MEELKTNISHIDTNLKNVKVHLSSPRDDRYLSLKGSSPHSNYIYTKDIIDFSFLDFDIVVDIEAKHKELAVLDFNKKLREVIL